MVIIFLCYLGALAQGNSYFSGSLGHIEFMFWVKLQVLCEFVTYTMIWSVRWQWSRYLMLFAGILVFGGTLVSIYRSFSWINCTTCLILSRIFWSKQFVVVFGSFSLKFRPQLSNWKSRMGSALGLCQMLSLRTRVLFGSSSWKREVLSHGYFTNIPLIGNKCRSGIICARNWDPHIFRSRNNW